MAQQALSFPYSLTFLIHVNPYHSHFTRRIIIYSVRDLRLQILQISVNSCCENSGMDNMSIATDYTYIDFFLQFYL